MEPVKLSEPELNAIDAERDSYIELTAGISAASKGWHGDGIELISIGAAAGTHNVVQGLPSGGFLLRCGGRTLIVDPGANSFAFLRRCGVNPYEITDVAATHAHNDHVGDLSLAVSAALSAGFGGTSDAGIVVCPALVDYSTEQATHNGFTLPAFAFSQYVTALSLSERTAKGPDGREIQAMPSVELSGGITIRATPAEHGTIEAIGFTIETPYGRIGYSGDTGYFPELEAHLRGVSVLWLNINTLGLRHFRDTGERSTTASEPVQNHLGYEGVCRLIDAIRPKTAIISHFGAQLLDSKGKIEELLRKRFEPLPIAIHVAHSGSVFRFPSTLDTAPTLARLQA